MDGATRNRPLVSIVLPTYNRARYLRESLDSCLRQTYENLELIVVDDASTDQTAEVLSSVEDNRLVILRNEHNLGAARSRNVALARARGEFIALMDSDDRCVAHRVERQVAFLQDNPELAAACSWARCIDAEGNPRQEGLTCPGKPEEVRAAIAQRPGAPVHATALLRARALQAVGGYRPLLYVEDYDLFLRLTDTGAHIGVIPEYLYEWRRHGDQETLTDWPTHRIAVFLAQEAAIQRRAGRRDPLGAVDYDSFVELINQTKRGRGYLGRKWHARLHWERALESHAMSDRRGWARHVLAVLRWSPGYGPLWHTMRAALCRRLLPPRAIRT